MSEIRKRKEGGEEKPVESAESDHVSDLFIMYFPATDWIITFFQFDIRSTVRMISLNLKRKQIYQKLSQLERTKFLVYWIECYRICLPNGEIG